MPFKIFLSHSSRQKLLVREVQRALPNFLDYWLDEKDINLGDNIASALDGAINNDCRFLLLFLDNYAAKSAWVKREIEWALKKEEKIGDVVLLPFVVDKDALDELSDYGLKDRKYVTCFDFSEEGISAACSQLMQELFAISYRSSGSSTIATEGLENDFINAEKTFARFARAFSEEIYPFRRANPLTTQRLLELVNDRHECGFSSVSAMLETLEKLKKAHQLQGYFFDADIAFLANETVNQKATLGSEEKRKLAKRAAAFVEDDMVICLDGGSTIDLLAEEICSLIETRIINGLSVVTNSVPIAEKLMKTLDAIGVRDRNSSFKIFLLGGLCRAVSMSTVQEEDDKQIHDFLLKCGVESFDYAFLGANGVHKNVGLANKSATMLSTKRKMFERSRVSLALLEGRKLDIEQRLVFAEFGPRLKIISSNAALEASNIKAIESAGTTITLC